MPRHGIAVDKKMPGRQITLQGPVEEASHSVAVYAQHTPKDTLIGEGQEKKLETRKGGNPKRNVQNWPLDQQPGGWSGGRRNPPSSQPKEQGGNQLVIQQWTHDIPQHRSVKTTAGADQHSRATQGSEIRHSGEEE